MVVVVVVVVYNGVQLILYALFSVILYAIKKFTKVHKNEFRNRTVNGTAVKMTEKNPVFIRCSPDLCSMHTLSVFALSKVKEGDGIYGSCHLRR